MNEPFIHLPDSPQGADRVVAELQKALAYREVPGMGTRLGGLAWLEAIYGLARRWEKTDDKGKPFYFPKVYTAEGDYDALHFDDRLQSQCFFVLHDPQAFRQFQPGMHLYRYELSIIFMVHFQMIDNRQAYGYPFTQVLVQEVIKVLSDFRKLGDLVIESVFTQEPAQVLDGFSIGQAEKRLFLYPRGCFRVKLRMDVPQDCVPFENFQFVNC